MTLQHPTCTDIAGPPITTIQRIYCYTSARGSINEIAITKIDTYMGWTILIGREKYQVTWHQLCSRDWCTYLILSICCTWQIDTSIGKYIADIAGAVKPTRRCSAEYIRYTDIVHGISYNSSGDIVRTTAYLWHGTPHQGGIGGRTYQTICIQTSGTLERLDSLCCGRTEIPVCCYIVAKTCLPHCPDHQYGKLMQKQP